MDPEWEHAYMCLKLQNFYPITNKPDHTEKKSLIQSSASQKASIFGSGQKM